MANLWDDLSNAKYIDAILVSVKAHPKEWGKVLRTITNNSYLAEAADAVSETIVAKKRHIEWYAARDAAWDATRDAAWDAAWGAAWDAIRALIAWDDCAYMLDSDLAEMEILARLGNHKAILLLPACKALNNIKESLTCNPI